MREDQRGASDRFANRSVDGVEIRFEEFQGECAIAGSLARLACRIVDRVPTGDHTFVVGEIVALEVDEGEPLVYFRSDYRRLA
jgi:flavin reductase (DIM6/NTAB) family NADH-FMN oxidoreductase RutF